MTQNVTQEGVLKTVEKSVTYYLNYQTGTVDRSLKPTKMLTHNN